MNGKVIFLEAERIRKELSEAYKKYKEAENALPEKRAYIDALKARETIARKVETRFATGG